MADKYLSVRGLQGAVAVVTAHLTGLDEMPQEQILGDTPPAEALHALSLLVASILNNTSPDALTAALRRAGAAAGEWEASDVQS